MYTGLRLLLFACVTGVLLVVGLRGFLLLLLALLTSSILSLFMLGPQRAALVLDQQDRLARREQEKAQLRARLDQDPPA